MRRIANSPIRTISSDAMPEFNSQQSPPFTSTSPPMPTQTPPPCDAQKCPWWPYSSSKDLKTNTALILVVLFCALVCALAINAAVRYFIHLRCSRRRAGQELKPTSTEEDGDDVEAQSTVVYGDDGNTKMKDSDCVICLSEFKAGDKVRVLVACGHSFHVSCVKTWLVAHGSCPTCRAACTVEDSVSGQTKTS